MNWKKIGGAVLLNGKYGSKGCNMFGNIYFGKKVLITGHTGFKGSWLAIWLRELGADVYGFALEPQSSDDNFEACHLAEIMHHRVGDVRDAAALLTYFEAVKPDLAFHCAAQSLVIESYKDPATTFQTNVLGTVNFFEAVRKVGVRAAVNITSDKCYENNELDHGYREIDPLGGRDPYSASKGCSEIITSSYARSFFAGETNSSVASARAGNVIGGGDWSKDRLVPDFFSSVRDDKSMTVRNPESIRPWQFVLEPLGGYLLLASKLFVDKSFSGPWNFGPLDGSQRVRDLLDNLVALTKMGKCYFSNDTPKNHEAKTLKLDISKASTLLNWRPVLNFEETIAFTVDGYMAQLKGQPLLGSRIFQIQSYCAKATEKKLSWTN
jgi:CDP-glucose 4,6-dehydratase